MATYTTPMGLTVVNDSPEALTTAGAPTAASTDAALARMHGAVTSPITPDRLPFVVASRNLYNPDDPDAMAGHTLSGSTPAASANYTLTGFIPVIPGQTYTLSNPRNWAFYDANREYVSGTSGVSSTSATTTLTAPAGAVYLRASFITGTYGGSFQVEKGDTATAYVPYKVTLSGVTVPADTTPVDPDRTTFAKASKNLVDPKQIESGKLLSATGNPVASANYSVTGFIPVVGGQEYTLSNPRNVATYTTGKTSIGSPGWYDNGTQGPLTITPAADGYIRTSFTTATYAATFQVEKGSAATGYEPFGLTIPDLSLTLPRAGAMRITRSGGAVTVTTDLGGQALMQTMNLTGSANGSFTWLATALGGITRHGCSDSITPLRTSMGTVGANHGFSQVRSFTNPDGKTTADVGSTWTDGATTYTLLAIEGGRLVLGAPATVSGAGAVTTSIVAPTADLTHVTGATKTGTIARSTISTSYQLLPSVTRVGVTATLDGGVLAEGDSTGQVLRISETYEILDYADLLTKAQADVGTPYTALNVAGALRVSNLYEMRAPGTWLVSTNVTALSKQSLNQCGFIQSEAMLTPSGGSLWRWVPGVKAISGNDWSAGVNITNYNTNTLVTSGDLADTTKPPTWSVDWLRDNTGADLLGFAHGYFPDKTDGSWSNRATAAVLWDLRGTKKSYPTVLTSRALDPGERVSVQAFRTYLPPSTLGFAVQDAQAGYGFTLASGAVAQPVPLPEQVGRTITTLGTHGLTVAPGVVDADGLLVTGTGSAVTKLT